MRIEIYTEDGLLTKANPYIESVFIKKADIGLDITINTVNRWCNFGYVGSSLFYLNNNPEKKDSNHHIAIAVYDGTENEEGAEDVVEIVIIAENEEEAIILQNKERVYFSQDKDQISVLVKSRSLEHVNKQQDIVASSIYNDKSSKNRIAP